MLNGKKILLVEDNKLNQTVTKRLFEQWDCIIEIATNGYEAIEKLKNFSFDIILMDIQMPGINGLETTNIIRKEINAIIPIIAMTAYSEFAIKQECMNIGINDIISKPFTKSELKKKLWNLLDEIPEKSIVDNKPEYLQNAYLMEITNGDAGLLYKLISIFIEESSNSIKIIRESTVNLDNESLRTALHKYKSSIKIFDIKQIEHLIDLTGNKLMNGNWSEISPLALKIIKLSEMEIENLKNVIKES